MVSGQMTEDKYGFAIFSLRATSRNGRGLSGTDFHLDGMQLRQYSGDRRLEVKFKRLAPIL